MGLLKPSSRSCTTDDCLAYHARQSRKLGCTPRRPPRGRRGCKSRRNPLGTSQNDPASPRLQFPDISSDPNMHRKRGIGGSHSRARDRVRDRSWGVVLGAFLSASLLAAVSLRAPANTESDGTPRATRARRLPAHRPSIPRQSETCPPPPLGGDVLRLPGTHRGEASFEPTGPGGAPEPGFLDTSRFMMGRSAAYAPILIRTMARST